MYQFFLLSSKELSKMSNYLMLFKTIIELLAILMLPPCNRGILGDSYSNNFFNDSFVHKGA